jgi:pimeloyl-ACP methyl ester carboxylesterase
MPILENFTQSNTLVIAATGVNGKLGMPVNAFFEASGLAQYSRIVIKDPTYKLALAGLSEECPTFSALIGYLRDQIARLGVDRVITTGNSAGGHSALLLGHLLSVDYVVVFGPDTYVSKGEMRRRRDPALKSAPRMIEAMNSVPENVKQYLDLRPILENSNGVTQYYVHVSRYYSPDTYRASYLEGVPNLRIISHPYLLHSIAPLLAKTGRLSNCFSFPYKRDRSLSLGMQRLANSARFRLKNPAKRLG